MAELRMPDLNKVLLAGRLTRDPEGKSLPSGTYLCKFGLAHSRKYKTNGEEREETLFIDATCWGKTAEFVSHAFTKGKPVLVEGRLTMDEWEDKTTGAKRSRIEINADRVQSLSWDEDGVKPQPTSRARQTAGAGAQDDILF